MLTNLLKAISESVFNPLNWNFSVAYTWVRTRFCSLIEVGKTAVEGTVEFARSVGAVKIIAVAAAVFATIYVVYIVVSHFLKSREDDTAAETVEATDDAVSAPVENVEPISA